MRLVLPLWGRSEPRNDRSDRPIHSTMDMDSRHHAEVARERDFGPIAVSHLGVAGGGVGELGRGSDMRSLPVMSDEIVDTDDRASTPPTIIAICIRFGFILYSNHYSSWLRMQSQDVAQRALIPGAFEKPTAYCCGLVFY